MAAILGDRQGLGDLNDCICFDAIVASEVLADLTGHVVGEGQGNDLLAGHIVNGVHAGLLRNLERNLGCTGQGIRCQQGDRGNLNAEGLELAFIAALGNKVKGQTMTSFFACINSSFDFNILIGCNAGFTGKVFADLTSHIVGQSQTYDFLTGYIVNGVGANLCIRLSKREGSAGKRENECQKKREDLRSFHGCVPPYFVYSF